MLASVCFGRWKSRPAQRVTSHSAVQGSELGLGAPRIHGELLQFGFMVSKPKFTLSTSASSAASLPYRYVLFDDDATFGNDVSNSYSRAALHPCERVCGVPGKNGVAERWVGSARREIRDHVIPINEHHFLPAWS